MNFTVPAPSSPTPPPGSPARSQPDPPCRSSAASSWNSPTGPCAWLGPTWKHTGEVTIEVAGDDTGRVVVPGRIFGDIVRNLPDGLVQVHAADGTLKVDCGQVSHELRLLDVADFPTLAEPSLDQALTLPGASFAAAAAQVGRAAAHDDARPVLSGVLIEAAAAQLALATTDSYRLAVRELACTWSHDPTSALIPARSLAEAARSLSGEDSVTVALEAHQADHRGRLPPPDHPPHRGEFQVPGPDPKRLRVHGHRRPPGPTGRPEAGQSLQHQQRSRAADLHHGPGGPGPHPAGRWHRPRRGRRQVQGDTLIAAFNPAYLADGIAGVTTEEVVLELQDGLKPALIRAADQDGYLYLLMPIRLP